MFRKNKPNRSPWSDTCRWHKFQIISQGFTTVGLKGERKERELMRIIEELDVANCPKCQAKFEAWLKDFLQAVENINSPEELLDRVKEEYGIDPEHR